MNQNGLAEILKMPASKISQILNKKREPDVPFLKGIHDNLGIDGNCILETVWDQVEKLGEEKYYCCFVVKKQC